MIGLAKRPFFTPASILIALVTLIFIVYGQVSAVPPKEVSQNQHTYLPLFLRPQEQNNAPTGIPVYGVNFISSAEDPADPQQYQNGLSTGADWNRWPLYWPQIETNAGQFDWTDQDSVVQTDLAQGLQINAILLGTPAFYATGVSRLPNTTLFPPQQPGPLALNAIQTATPQGLFEPIFNDGSDQPGSGKIINPANRWATFVFLTVQRYKPGGILAEASSWPEGVGITHWEMWNEPDLPNFWDSSLADYARLLKVGYLAAKQADSQSTILFGGLAYFSRPDFYKDVLAIYAADPLAQSHYFHDVVAVHNYSCSWKSWQYVYLNNGTQRNFGLDKPIWLNESGVPAWDDYPGPVWDPASNLRASMQEQADFLIQSALYATFAGADAYFHFQLYDGCGNQPQGTDFQPHNGELCTPDGMLISDPRFPCSGDANGLFSNPTDASCFRQHPQPETARPNLAAYQVLAGYFTDVEPLWRRRPGSNDPYNGPQEWIAFYKPHSGERIVGLWTRFGENETAVVPAAHSQAKLITPDGGVQTITPVNGNYTIVLPGATNTSTSCWPNATPYAIGGRPFLLIEPDTRPPDIAAAATVTNTTTIALSWQGDDNLGSGLIDYTVQVAVNNQMANSWLTHFTGTTAVYNGQPGHTYTFTIAVRDRAGNVGTTTVMTTIPNP